MPTEDQPIQQYGALLPQVYKKLEAQCPKPIISAPGDPVYAAYALGVQHVLKLLREGFVVG